MLWIIFAFLTTVAVVSILWPLAKSPGAKKARDTSRALYFAQLAEIARDEAQNWVSAADAQAARDEAARRLMGRVEAEERQRKSLAPPGKRAFLATMAVLLLVPGFSVILYSRIGHPDWPDAPLSARLSAPPSETDMAAAIAKIEAHLAEHPEDGRGYEVLAPVYLRLGRSEDAVHAASEALRLLGPNAQRLALYGETLVAAADGQVSPQARQVFEGASDADPQAIKPRLFLGLAAEQAGDTARAKKIWEKLIAEAPADAPWVRILRQRIEAFNPNAPDNASPEKDSKAAVIAGLPEADQMQAIRGMVEGLAERLARNGQDLEGWLRLVRSYVVLKDADKAQAALSDAKRNLAADPQAIARLDALAKELGLKGSS